MANALISGGVCYNARMKNSSKLSKPKPEIMAPAGDWTSLSAAINAGADAVYFGLHNLSMRANAKNFALGDLPKIVKLCRGTGVKAYLTLNTIVFDGEVERVDKIVRSVAQHGVDAIIAWDFAVIQKAAELSVPVFVSTQVSIANSSALLYLHRAFGIKRFVLARECSLNVIKGIKKSLIAALGAEKAAEIEIEVFAHGAMCVSISGRCFLSQFHFDASANRGDCRQPCRREFAVKELRDGMEYTLGNSYVMSPRDLCIIPFIEKVLELGVASLKIEGRGRSPEYVSVVTDAYRRVVDFYYDQNGSHDFKTRFQEIKIELMQKLEAVYNRGFSSGFFLGKPIDQWVGGDGTRASQKKEYIGLVENYFKKPGVAQIKVEDKPFKVGDEIMFHGSTTGVYSQVITSIELDQKPVQSARRGDSVTVAVKSKVRRQDKIYIMKDK